MRLSRTTALVAAALPLVAGAALIATTRFANAAGAAFPAHYAAPYLQIWTCTGAANQSWSVA